MGRLHRLAAATLLACLAAGCAMFEGNRTACRWTAAGVGLVAGGLTGALTVNALDVSSTKQGGAIAGAAIGVGALGAAIGGIAGYYACPDDPAAAAPPPPAGEPAPDAPAAAN
jgi:hypothetical protein